MRVDNLLNMTKQRVFWACTALFLLTGIGSDSAFESMLPVTTMTVIEQFE
jgi:hypothetical protein